MASEHIPTWNFIQVNASATAAAYETAKENSTRQANVEIIYISTGTGQHRMKTAVDFTCNFTIEPHFVSGSGVINNPDPKTWNDPRGDAGVYAWKMSKEGLYTGAHLWLRVDMDLISGVPVITAPKGVKTAHFMTFSGQAVKDVSTPDTITLKTRNVNL